MPFKLKVKQLTSGNESIGKVLKTDGLGSFEYNDVIDKGISFPDSPSSGDTFYRTDVDMLFYYDGIRNKWLSVNKPTFVCGRNRLQKNTLTYYQVGDAVQTSTSGFNMLMNGTITGISIDNNNTVTNINGRTLDIRVNNSTTNRYQLTVTNGNKSANATNVNLDFNSGDILQAILLPNNTDDFDNSIVKIEVSWRV